jgi:hypothetical protein
MNGGARITCTSELTSSFTMLLTSEAKARASSSVLFIFQFPATIFCLIMVGVFIKFKDMDILHVYDGTDIGLAAYIAALSAKSL